MGKEKGYVCPRALARLRLPEKKKLENIAMQASKMAPSKGQKKNRLVKQTRRRRARKNSSHLDNRTYHRLITTKQ